MLLVRRVFAVSVLIITLFNCSKCYKYFWVMVRRWHTQIFDRPVMATYTPTHRERNNLTIFSHFLSFSPTAVKLRPHLSSSSSFRFLLELVADTITTAATLKTPVHLQSKNSSRKNQYSCFSVMTDSFTFLSLLQRPVEFNLQFVFP